MGMQNWRTPRELFDRLNRLFGPFVLDASADDENHLCESYFTRQNSGLERDWQDITFANPPFELAGEVACKAAIESIAGIRSVLILPVGCSQRWFHLWGIFGTIYYPEKRIGFDTPDGRHSYKADRDSMVVCFGGEHKNPLRKEGVFAAKVLPK